MNKIEKRWEEGKPHHPAALSIVEYLKKHFNKKCDYDHILKCGGDGDPGEDLLLMLSQMFEDTIDKGWKLRDI